jgi:hypothetical protein
MAVVYFLRLKSGVICIGASIDLEQRLDDQTSGQACRTTAIDPPVALLRVEVCAAFPANNARLSGKLVINILNFISVGSTYIAFNRAFFSP